MSNSKIIVHSYRGKGQFDPPVYIVYLNKPVWFRLSVLKLLSYRTGMNLFFMKIGMTFSDIKICTFLVSIINLAMEIIDSAHGNYFTINSDIRD